MSARILFFPSEGRRAQATASLTRDWIECHFPLVDAALDLLRADEREFRRRVRSIAENEGRSVLDQLVMQLERLAGHLAEIVANLSMVAKRIRRIT